MSARVWCVALILMAIVGGNAQAQTEMHGSTDAFAAPGVGLAWAIARGATENDTNVVLRIVSGTTVFPSIAVVGVDPFSKQEKVWRAASPSPGALEIRIPRPQFGDFPRTEVRLYSALAPSPALVVFYLGVPDTTPEFTDSAKLDAYLADRIARMRATAGVPSP